MATEKLIVELDAKTSEFNRKIDESGSKAKKSTDKIAKGFKKVEDQSKKTTEGVKKFTVATIAGAVSAALVTRKMIQYADAMTSITNKLKLATSSTEELNKVTSDLFDLSNNTRASVVETVSLYSKLERSTRGLNLSQDRLLNLTGSINKSFAITGATTQEASGAIRQLGQSLQSGALRGEEYNSISEQAPIIMEAIRAATGKTAGELRKLAATGAITSEVLIESLERYKDKIDTDYSQATATFSQKMEVAENNTIKFVGANKQLNKIIGTSGDAIVGLSNNIDVLITAGEIAVVLFGSRLAASLATSAFQAGLTAIATARAAGSLTLMGAAAGTASKAMALLGGPVGVLITVVASLALFVDWETKSEKATKNANVAIDQQIDSLKGLSAAQLEIKNQEFARLSFNNAKAISELTTEINKATEAQEKLKEQHRQSTPEFSINGRKIVDMKEALQGLFEEQSRIQKLGGAIFGAKLEPDLPTEGDKPLIDLEGGGAEEKRAAALEKQKLADEQELQTIIDRLKTESELLNEQFEQEKEILELRIEDKTIFNEALLGLENEYQDNLKVIKEKELKAEQALANKKVRLAQQEKRDKLAAIDDTRKNIQIGKGLNEALFNDNKSIKKGLIIADTAAAITRQFADLPFYPALATSAIIAASGLTQLKNVDSATRGGGSITASGGGASIDQAQSRPSEGQQVETSTLDVTEQSEEGVTTNTIRFDTESGDEFLDTLAGLLNQSQRNGRTT